MYKYIVRKINAIILSVVIILLMAGVSWSQTIYSPTIDLTSRVTGILPTTNGGTGIATGGSIIVGKNGEAGAMAIGDVCYAANGGTATIPTFKFAKADTTATGAYPALAMCYDSSIASGATGQFILRGTITNSSWSELTLGGGETGGIWVSVTGTTSNTFTQTKPVTSGNVQQYLGCAVNDSYSATHTGKSKTILFNPMAVWNIAP